MAFVGRAQKKEIIYCLPVFTVWYKRTSSWHGFLLNYLVDLACESSSSFHSRHSEPSVSRPK